MNGEPLPRAWKIAVFGLLVLAIAVRVPFLFGYGIDDDEFYTLRYALDFFGDPTPKAASGWPMLFIVTRSSLELFGVSAFALRAFPFACGVASVALLFSRGRRLVGDRSAILAAGLLALWPWHQYWSGMARYYAPLFLAGILLIDGLESLLYRPSRGAMAATLLAAIFAAAIHPAGLLGACGLGVLFLDRTQRARFGTKRLVIVAAGLLLGLLLLTRSGLWESVQRVLSGDGGEGADAIQLVFNLGFNVTPLFVALAVIGWIAVNREDRDRARFLAASAVLPVVLLGALAALGQKVQGRYAMVGFPALLWLAGAGVAQLQQRARVGFQRVGIAAACALPLLPSIASNLLDGDRHDLLAGTRRLARELTGNEMLYAEGHGLVTALMYGVDRGLPATLGQPPFPQYLGECPPPAAALAEIERSRTKTYFLVPERDVIAPGADSRDFSNWLRAHAHLVERFHSVRFDYHRNPLLLLVANDAGAS